MFARASLVLVFAMSSFGGCVFQQSESSLQDDSSNIKQSFSESLTTLSGNDDHFSIDLEIRKISTRFFVSRSTVWTLKTGSQEKRDNALNKDHGELYKQEGLFQRLTALRPFLPNELVDIGVEKEIPSLIMEKFAKLLMTKSYAPEGSSEAGDASKLKNKRIHDFLVEQGVLVRKVDVSGQDLEADDIHSTSVIAEQYRDYLLLTSWHRLSGEE